MGQDRLRSVLFLVQTIERQHCGEGTVTIIRNRHEDIISPCVIGILARRAGGRDLSRSRPGIFSDTDQLCCQLSAGGAFAEQLLVRVLQKVSVKGRYQVVE
jgi:hypothetical protein